MKEVLGAEFFDKYLAAKKREWETYLQTSIPVGNWKNICIVSDDLHVPNRSVTRNGMDEK